VPSLAGVTQPVTVQLQNSAGLCWEAVYSAPATSSSATLLKDRAD
jgi:hypothetical protein